MTPYLTAKDVTKSYDGRCIIDSVSMQVQKGELVSLLGLSGIGKTTLFHVLSGLEQPDSGQVLLSGEDITGKAGRVSYMQQKDLLLPFQTVLDNVSIPLRLGGMKKKAAHEKALPYLEEFGLSGCEEKYPHELSGGMRQRAALLRCYLYSGDMMLLDEPFSALDAITKSSLHQWFQSVVRRHGTTAVFITHDIDEAILLSDRVYIMSGAPGRITGEIPITCAGKRDRDFTMTEEFIRYKKEILSRIGADAE
ncbi:MAG: ABC transporter ATP-binding protein [Clostridiales bacterium]|nr:ABC transporter ATP-binding protein [Clostridiales bacterium]